MSNDINFVLNYNFENDESINKYKEKYKNNLNIEDLIKIIKQTIQYFSDENKTLIFEYLQILSQITIVYMSKI
jgi:aryl-phospho-beta-D-glucosidase BglC (GH1 family)